MYCMGIHIVNIYIIVNIIMCIYIYMYVYIYTYVYMKFIPRNMKGFRFATGSTVL